MNENKIKQNENNIFLNIKEMIKIENKEKQPNEKEKMENVLNDVYNKDLELEEFLKEHKSEKQKINNNLINLNNNNNILIYLNDNSNNNLMNFKKDDYQDKNIFTISMDKLDDLFKKINKKFDLNEIECIPIYLENPEKYDNFSL